MRPKSRRGWASEPGVLSVTTGAGDLPPGSLRLDFSGDDAALSDLLARLVGRGLPIVSFSEEKGDLEDVFLQVTQGAVDA